MDKADLRVSISLAFVYSLNLLGMFLLLPVLVIYATKLNGGSAALAGFAFGVYGLMRLLMQLPLAMLSDKIGRKKVIYAGLVCFILGSIVCGLSTDIYTLIVGRFIQGAGAVGAVVTALLADLTNDENRTRAMAIIGGAIGLSFSVSMVVAPILAASIGVNGIFFITGALAIVSIFIIAKIVPAPHHIKHPPDREFKSSGLWLSLSNIQLLRLNFGVFCLHFTQMSLFVALPLFLVNTFGLNEMHHWYIYLPAVIVGFICMVPFIIIGEKKGKLKAVMLFAISCVLLVQLLLCLKTGGLGFIILLLSLYFLGFNLLEAILPSLISKIAPIAYKGTALGIHNTCQSLGLFLGGSVGGLVYQYYGIQYVYLECAIILFIWLLFVISMPNPNNVRTIVRSIPIAWRDNISGLILKLKLLPGMCEIIADEKEYMLYFKVSPKTYEKSEVERILLEM